MRRFHAPVPLTMLTAACLAVACQSAPAPAPARDDLPGRLESDVRFLCALPGGRAWDGPSLDAAADFIAARFRALGLAVEEQRYLVAGRTYRNVLAASGRGPATVVVGAHYDTCGPLPGADDNASGVAGLMALAGRLAAGPPPPYRLVLAAWTLEEPPFFAGPDMGSARHAAALKAAGGRVACVLVLEMIGCFSDEPGSQRYPLPGMDRRYPDRGNFLAAVGRPAEGRLLDRIAAAFRAAGGLPCLPFAAPAGTPGVDLSDHRNFRAAGFPAVMLTDTADYRNPRYHSADDRPETLDYHRLAAVVAGVHRFLEEYTP